MHAKGVCLGAFNSFMRIGITMNRDKYISPIAVGYGCPIGKRNKSIIIPCVNDLYILVLLLNHFAQLQSDCKSNIFFLDTPIMTSGIEAAMAGINDHRLYS